MRIGPFYYDAKEVFLLAAAGLLGGALYFGWPLWVYEPRTLLTLAIMILITKGLLQSTHNDVFFFHGVVAFVAALFLSTFQVVLFYVLTFVVLKALRVL